MTPSGFVKRSSNYYYYTKIFFWYTGHYVGRSMKTEICLCNMAPECNSYREGTIRLIERL